MATKKEEPQEMDRSVVKVGIDLTPIQLDMGDGNIWNLSPDPSPAQFGKITRVMNSFRGLKNEDIEEKLEELLSELSDSLRELVTETAQKKKWDTRAYGIFAMQALAKTYMQALSGTPTK